MSRLVIALLFLSPLASAAEKIGYVDLQRAMTSTTAGKTAKDTLTKEFEKRKKDIQSKQDELKKLNEEFEKKSMVMNPKAREESQLDFQKKALAYQQFLEANQKQMQEKEAELTKPIFEKMDKIIAEISKDKGLAFMLEKNRSAVLFAQQETDFTEELIKRYESQAKK